MPAQAEKQKHDRDCEQDEIGPREFTRYRPLHEYRRVTKSRHQAEDKSRPDLPIYSLHKFVLIRKCTRLCEYYRDVLDTSRNVYWFLRVDAC